TAQTVAPLSPELLCGYMEQTLSSLVQALEHAPQTPVNQLDVLPPDTRTLLVSTWNDTETAYPSDLCIHQLFEQQVQRTPDAIALVFEDESLTYAQLNARANQLAHHLIAQGVRPEDRVALCVERGIGMVVSLLATLKAGAAYVPLDPAYPGERLSHILTDSAPRLLLADAAGHDALGDTGTLTVLDPNVSLDGSEDDPQVAVASHHLAYVLFTSGSTGKPKGVMVEHREMLNFLCSMRDITAMSAADTLLAVTTISFDIAGLELYLPLSTGACIVLARRSDAADPIALQALIDKHEVSFMQATPATWRMLLDAQWTGNAQLTALCGGEALSAALAARLREKVRSLWNVYGPTETTVWSSCYEVGLEAQNSATVPVGRPIANTRMYLLDAQYRLVPPGAVGELYIGGAGVARGYLNRPDLTAERFIDDPFVAGARMYRTGDIARYRPDGNIEFLGRNDHQVKIRGFRIELGEIEAQIASHPAVREAVVIARARHEATQDQQLIAYVTLVSDASDLREHLNSRLPDYMVPSAFVVLDALPLTPNGKLDRRALPDPQWQDLAAYVAPRSSLEHSLAECFASVLGLERVSVFDNFFALGGHSLLATQLVSRLREALAIELPLRTLFDAPSVASLAEALEESSREASALPPLQAMPRPAKLPLSFAQERLWFLEQLNPEQSTYNIPVAVRLSGSLDVSAFENALNALVARHESLRTSFTQHDGQAVQCIASELRITLPLVVLSDDGQVRRLAQAEATRAFDLQHGPLLRAQLLRLAADEHVLLFTMHHIISDGWSTGVLVRELGACYTASLLNEPPALPPLAVQYADFTLWQRDWLAGAELER
ncbi:non-ribosomal peptide synthetase, partial [Caballeronia cordobensis]|uniref:non-ribosomal peptide synthetase n=1 Tax=Caballeronia cordobensis TaxID=1353886 RepID=UPI000ABF61EA